MTLSKIDPDFIQKSIYILKEGNLNVIRLNYLDDIGLSEVNFQHEIPDYKVLNVLDYLKNKKVSTDHRDEDSAGEIARNWDHRLSELKLI